MSAMDCEESVIEADAGTPQIPGGDGRPVRQQTFPWENASGTPNQNGNNHGTANNQDRYGDGVDPINWLAKLTMWLAHPSCVVLGVPLELRSILSEEIVTKSLHISEKFLQRLADLNVISEGFHEELKDLHTNQTATPGQFDIFRQTFLNYLIRKDMASVLNFTKVLYEDHMYDPVSRIVDYLKRRKVFEGPSKPVSRASEDSWVAEGADVQVRPGKYQGGSRVYPMTSNPRGHILIINNENFAKSAKYSDRLGTHVDGAKLSHLFQGLSFNLYRGTQFRDLTRREMRALVQEFALYEDHQNVNASVVCILSHGDEYGIVGTDGEPLTDRDIQDNFTAENCPHLANKPKIFLFVACRGSSIDNGKTVDVPVLRTRLLDVQMGSEPRTSADGTTGTDFRISSEVEVGNTMVPAMELTRKQKIPNNVDFITIYATVPGYRSLRDIDKGTWFVQDFVEVVAKEAYLNDLATMVCEVNNRLSERVTKDGEKQSLSVLTTLRKNLFFNPGF